MITPNWFASQSKLHLKDNNMNRFLISLPLRGMLSALKILMIKKRKQEQLYSRGRATLMF